MKRQHNHCPSCGKMMPKTDTLPQEIQDEIKEAARMSREGVSE